MRPVFDIIVAGVGGQGSLVCGRVLARAALLEGLRPVTGDTFGASRRGGSVLTHVRLGHGSDPPPLVPRGHLDLLLGLEPLEALRAAQCYAGSDTVALVSTLPVHTTETLSGTRPYPPIDSLLESLRSLCSAVSAVDPSDVLRATGSGHVVNVYMLGAMCGALDLPVSTGAVRTAVNLVVGMGPANRLAFERGMEATGGGH